MRRPRPGSGEGAGLPLQGLSGGRCLALRMRRDAAAGARMQGRLLPLLVWACGLTAHAPPVLLSFVLPPTAAPRWCWRRTARRCARR